MNCIHCGKDKMAHSSQNLRCPDGDGGFRVCRYTTEAKEAAPVAEPKRNERMTYSARGHHVCLGGMSVFRALNNRDAETLAKKFNEAEETARHRDELLAACELLLRQSSREAILQARAAVRNAGGRVPSQPAMEQFERCQPAEKGDA